MGLLTSKPPMPCSILSHTGKAISLLRLMVSRFMVYLLAGNDTMQPHMKAASYACHRRSTKASSSVR
jgi:hypothetical protein